MMRVCLARFLKSEDGAVTVDWVVLTAALVTFGIAVASTVADGATDTSSGIGAKISELEVAVY